MSDYYPCSEQLPLLDQVPHNGTDTSREAAKQFQLSSGKVERGVLRFFQERGERGATDEEVFAALSLRESTLRARRCSLRDRGLVKDSGRRRRTCAGRLAIVWVYCG